MFTVHKSAELVSKAARLARSNCLFKICRTDAYLNEAVKLIQMAGRHPVFCSQFPTMTF